MTHSIDYNYAQPTAAMQPEIANTADLARVVELVEKLAALVGQVEQANRQLRQRIEIPSRPLGEAYFQNTPTPFDNMHNHRHIEWPEAKTENRLMAKIVDAEHKLARLKGDPNDND